MTHTKDPVCAGCEAKLITAHPDLSHWYRVHVKPLVPNIHVDWAFRNKQQQEDVVASGASSVRWPESKHNHMQDGVPCSLALDLFEQIEGKYYSRYKTYLAIHENNQRLKLPIRWGWFFTSRRDGPHFELILVDQA